MPTPTTKSGLTLCQLAERDERVFPSFPQVARYFPSASMEDARKRLGRAIERGDGPGLVIGAPGTGKSLLLQVLAAQFHERFDVVLLAATRLCTRRALLQAILFELGLPYKLRDEGELRLSLLDHLLSANECPTGLLLLVDEAQALSPALLDELRVMTNLVRGDRPRVRLVLAGTSALEESFAHPELESFSQRLSARCYLAPLRREETTQFIRAQVAASQGVPDEIFATDVWEAIFEATDGVPRLVNQLCDRALQLGAADGRSRIDRELVQRAWSDLQQLPSPWETPSAPSTVAPTGQVVEFGRLDGESSVAVAELRSDDEIVEPTELDLDDDVPTCVESAAPLPQRESAAAIAAANPFAEPFEEEEVVLDAFAAWDDMFRRATPRVENRREPGFATLVRAALEAAAPAGESRRVDTPPLGVLRDDKADELTSDAGDLLTRVADEAPAGPDLDDTTNWPPLRLAVVSEAAPLNPVPLLAPSTRVGGLGAAALAAMTAADITRGAGKPFAPEAPVLVVEEDGLPGQRGPAVRREEYRNLFSRLRSG